MNGVYSAEVERLDALDTELDSLRGRISVARDVGLDGYRKPLESSIGRVQAILTRLAECGDISLTECIDRASEHYLSIFPLTDLRGARDLVRGNAGR